MWAPTLFNKAQVLGPFAVFHSLPESYSGRDYNRFSLHASILHGLRADVT
jgi:hypothetical protein